MQHGDKGSLYRKTAFIYDFNKKKLQLLQHPFFNFLNKFTVQIDKDQLYVFTSDADPPAAWWQYKGLLSNNIEANEKAQPLKKRHKPCLISYGLDSFIYLVSGWNDASVNVYDIANDTWSEAPALIDWRFSFAGCASGDFLYVYGGHVKAGNGKCDKIERLNARHHLSG